MGYLYHIGYEIKKDPQNTDTPDPHPMFHYWKLLHVDKDTIQCSIDQKSL